MKIHIFEAKSECSSVKNLRNQLVILSLGLLSHKSVAQHSISGKCIDQAHRPVPYLDVIASSGDRIAKGTLTDSAGVFRLALPDGSYILSVTFLGKTLFEKCIDLTQSLQLGTIQVDTDMQLKEVVVSTRKKLIEQKVDRLVFNVANSLAAAGGDALDALRITPGLRVQNDQISMTGKGSLRVMVDGRILPLSGSDLTDYLQSISADDIERIEVVTTPPARYEAEGNSGLIDIVLKKSKTDYIGGSVSGSYRQQTYADYTTGIQVNYQKDNLSLSHSINWDNGKTGPDEDQTLYYKDFTLDNKSKRKDYIDRLGIRNALDYRWSSHLKTGMTYHFSTSKPDQSIDAWGRYINKISDRLDSLFICDNLLTIEKTRHDLHGYADYKIDTLGKKISLDVGYLNQRNHSKGRLYSELFIQDISRRKDTTNNALAGNFNATTLSTDVQLPYQKFKLSLGGKLSFSHAKNDFKQYRYKGGQLSLDTHASDLFDYTENTQALYGDFSKDGHKMSLKLGLRLENTETTGKSITPQQTNKNNYTKLFPTFYASYKMNESHTFGFAYGRRIGRPYYHWLDPFRRYFNPTLYMQGNPFLQPAFTDNFKLYDKYKSLHTQLWFSKTTGGQEYLLLASDDPDIQVIKTENFITRYTAGISVYYAYEKMGFWRNYNELKGMYAKERYDIDSITDKELEKFGFYFHSTHSFTLNRKKTVSAELDYWLTTPFLGDAAVDRGNQQELDMGFRFLLFHKKLSAAIYAADICKTTQSKGSTIGLSSVPWDYNNYYDLRSLKFSLRYHFGKELHIKERKQNNQAEKNRL